jgi:hypothetical protein
LLAKAFPIRLAHTWPQGIKIRVTEANSGLFAALFQSSFHIDYPSSSDSDLIGQQERAFTASSTFPTENVVEHHRTAGPLDQPLVHHPDSVTNGLGYAASLPGGNDVP